MYQSSLSKAVFDIKASWAAPHQSPLTRRTFSRLGRASTHIVLDTIASRRTPQDINFQQHIGNRARRHTAYTPADRKDGECHRGDGGIIA